MEGLEGVIAAIEYAREKAAKQRAQTVTPAAPQPAPPSGAAASAPASARPSAPAQTPAPVHAEHAEHAAKNLPLQAMFEDGNSLLRAIVAAEILGPPAALRPAQESTSWNRLPNEP